MKHYQDYSADDQNFSIGNQPRKSVLYKSKKSYAFKKIDQEVDHFEKHRHSYKRAADKNFTRAQLREDQLFS